MSSQVVASVACLEELDGIQKVGSQGMQSLRALELSQGAQRARKSPPRATRLASSSTNNASEAVPLTRSYGRDRRGSNASASTIFGGGAGGNRLHHASGSVGGGSSISGRANGLGHGGRQRMMSIVGTPTSLMFDLTNDVIPISLSEDTSAQNRAPVAKTIGLVNGIALVVGNQIGSGIFSSPGVVLADSGSVGASLMLIRGARLCNSIEVKRLLFTTKFNTERSIAVLKPGSNAIISSILGEYLNRLFFHATAADASPDSIPQWAIKLTACISVIIVSILCVATPKLATRVAVLFTSAKIAVLIAVTVMGIIQLSRGKASTAFREPLFEGTSPNPSAFALALFSGLWAYEGWDQANYITGEMKDPAKNMPRVIHSSMTTVT
ncbi:15759_t:CDS:10, partial [Acaulospora colombiana]